MPTPIVAGNWKMNTTLAGAVELATEVRKELGKVSGVDVVLCPPSISLASVRKAVEGSAIQVGAQNMFHEPSGAYTGELSPLMLHGICNFVILGHSERRQIFGETDASINRKVKSAFQHNLRPIFCVGETLEQREHDQAEKVVSQQVLAGLAELTDITGLVVAYEPVWAIGTGRAATPQTAAEIMGGPILKTLHSLFGDAANAVPLLYGGSVNPANAESFMTQNCIHGGLVGGASLQAAQFAQIVQATARAKVSGK